jgi:putative ABC transport system permease protein
VAAVLLIACANVTNLLLARGASRHKEMVLRAALGAGRGRLVRQLLAESATLCLLGGVAGLSLAALLVWSSRPAVAALLPPYAEPVRLDLRVLAFATAAALGSTLLVGLLPSLRASSVRLSQALNETARSVAGGRSRLRRTIVVAEVAASLVLVCGAMVLVRTLGNLQGLATGVRIENVLTLSAALPAAEYPTPESATQFYDAVVARLQSVPGVERAGLATQLPLLWISNGEGVHVPGVEKPINVRFKRVDPGYFPSLDVALAVGRGFEQGDREGAEPVLIVNETLAAALGKVAKWTDPVDHTVRIQYPDYTNHSVTRDARIVGVIRSERVGGAPGQPAPPVVYVPLAQAPQPSVRLVVGTGSEPATLTPSLRAAIREVAPNLPLGDVATLREVHRRLYNEPRRTAWVVGAFAAVAALLAGLGLYGVLTHSVSQRRREIGIRVALGARSGDVVRQVLANAASLVAVGLGLGLFAVLGLTRVLRGLLFQVSALDPASLSLACAAMLGVGLFAAFGPAHRATTLDPMAVLRDEG